MARKRRQLSRAVTVVLLAVLLPLGLLAPAPVGPADAQAQAGTPTGTVAPTQTPTQTQAPTQTQTPTQAPAEVQAAPQTQALPTLSISDVSQAEGNSGNKQFVFTVTLTGSHSNPVKVDYATANGTATTTSDYTPQSGSLSFPSNQSTRTIVVPVKGDTVVEPDETFVVNLTNPVGATITKAQGTGTITNDDSAPPPPGQPALSINNVSKQEGNSSTTDFTFSVSLSAAAGVSGVTFDIATADGTATTADNDYVAKSLTSQTIAAGSTSYSFTVAVNGDTTVEPDESFSVNVTNVVGATVADGQGTGTITNDDTGGGGGGGQPSLSINNVSKREGDSGATNFDFTVSLSANAPAGGVTFDIGTADGTATTADNDYVAKSLTNQTIAAGSKTATFTVVVNGDTTAEPDETFSVNVTNVTGATVADGQGTGTITNDDTGGGGGGTVPTISINDVTKAEGQTGLTPFVFTVSLSTSSNKPVSVAYATAPGTTNPATAGTDYQTTSGTLSFKGGETSLQVTVQVIGDTVSEQNETFFVNLSSPNNATILDGQGLGTITNDDNQAPTATAQSGLTTDEDTAKTITLAGTDPENDPLTFKIASLPGHGTLYQGSSTAGTQITSVPTALTTNQVTYLPNANYNGTDSFDFKANDGFNDSAPATIGLSVTAVNDPPTATSQSVSTTEDTAKLITLAGTDPENSPLTFSISALAGHGTLYNGDSTADADKISAPASLTGATVTYKPDANYSNSGGNDVDTFQFTANDGTLASATAATVSITVGGVNDAPTANAQSVTTDEDTAKQITLTGSDPDNCELTFSIVSGPSHGTLSDPLGAVACTAGSPNTDSATVTYTPAANFNGGTDSFTFKVNDGTVDSAAVTVSLNVTAVNDLPVADAQSGLSTNEDTALPVTLTGSDVETCDLTFSIVSGPSHGTLSDPLGAVACTAGSPNTDAAGVTYTPATNYSGSDSFTFKVNDGTADSTAATVAITVIAVNDPPTANAQSVTTDEDTAKLITLTGSDPDNCELTFSIVDQPTKGSLGSIGTTACTAGTPNTDGAGVTYTPTTNVNGSDSFTFKVNDGTVDSATVTVSITITAVNDLPTADAQSGLSTNEDTALPITLTGSDVETCDLTFSIVSGPSHGSLGSIGTTACTAGTPNTDGGGVTYTPSANYFGSDSFTFKVNDGTADSTAATVAITVNPINDAPSFTKGADQGTPTPLENQNVDGTAKAYTINPWATAISAGPGETQTVSFEVTNVTSVQTTCTSFNDLFTVEPAVSSTGVLTFTTDPTQCGKATVTLRIHDDGGTTNGGVDTSTTQTFTIETKFPPPVANDDPATATYAAQYAATRGVPIDVPGTFGSDIGVTANDVLNGGHIKSYGILGTEQTTLGTAIATTAGGFVTLNANGSFRYEPPCATTATSDTFKYVLENGGGSDSATVTIALSGQVCIVNAAAATSGNGSLTHPFKALGDVPGTRNTDGVLYFLSGTYTRADAAGVTLKANEHLVGQGVALSGNLPSSLTLAPRSDTSGFPAAGTAPTISTTFAGANGVVLATGNTIKGVTLGNAPGSALSGTSFGTLTIGSAVNVSTTGRALNLDTGTLAGSFAQVSSSGGVNNVRLNAVQTSSAVTLGAVADTLSGATAESLLISGQNGSFTYPGTITNAGGTLAVSVTGKTGGTVELSGNINPTTAAKGILVQNNSTGTNTITFSGTQKKISTGAGVGVNLDNNDGATITFSNGGLVIGTNAGIGFQAINGAVAVNVGGGGNTINSTNATALKVDTTTIGGSGLTFQSISAGNNDGGADPVNGIVLNNTGTAAGLTVTGDGGSTKNSSGGTIQHTSGSGILLTSTKNASFDQMDIHDTAGSGVRGTTGITNFTFTNGSMDHTGSSSGPSGGNQESSIAFNDPTGSATDAKITGTVTITGNTLNNALWHGVSILQFAGQLDDVNISNNSLTSGTTTATGGSSLGSGIQLVPGGTGSASSSVTRAELNGNTITNFPGGVLIAVQCGTANGSGPTNKCGTVGSSTDDIEIKNNFLNGGGTTSNGAGGVVKPNQVMLITVNGRGTGNFTIQDNGTVNDPLSGSAGNIIDISAGGSVTVQATVTGNRMDAAGQTVGGTSGIAAGVGPFDVTGLGTLSSATLYANVQNNFISNSAGTGIRLNVNAGDPTLNAIVKNNTVGAPISATYGIQVVQGSNAGFTGNTNLEISGNTTAGSSGGGNTFPGIGLRKFGTTAGEFNIVGLTPSPATNAQMESYVSGQNPASSSGNFGTGGVAAVNGSSSNWTTITAVPQP